MYSLLIAIRRLLVWLGEVEDRSQPTLQLRDWADRPTYHPCS